VVTASLFLFFLIYQEELSDKFWWLCTEEGLKICISLLNFLSVLYRENFMLHIFRFSVSINIHLFSEQHVCLLAYSYGNVLSCGNMKLEAAFSCLSWIAFDFFSFVFHAFLPVK